MQLAAGGTHCVALTHDFGIFTWGVNDLGALGRDTVWDGGMVDIKDCADGDADGSDSEDSKSSLSPQLPLTALLFIEA